VIPERSVLRLREARHIDPARRDETIIEVLRDGVPAAYIYGTREGVQIVSSRISTGRRLGYLEVGGTPSLIVPLLEASEPCPWCEGKDPACLLCGGQP
jgi:hypothetical protein